MHENMAVDLTALEQASQGVKDAVQVLADEIGWLGRQQMAGQGYGITYLKLDADTLGAEDLASALDEFCNGWDHGVEYLIDEGRAAADALTDTRSTYEKVEDAVQENLKKVLVAAAGDPTTSNQQAAQKSVGDIAATVAPGPLPDGLSQELGNRVDRSISELS